MYSQSFIVYRNATTTSTATDTATATYTGNCLIQPITDTTRLLNANNWGKEYRMWSDVVSIRVGDLVSINNTKYGVVGIPERIDLDNGMESHLEVRIVKK